MNFAPLTEREESIAKKIVDAAYTVHKNLGPGLLEKVYSPCWIIVFTGSLLQAYSYLKRC